MAPLLSKYRPNPFLYSLKALYNLRLLRQTSAVRSMENTLAAHHIATWPRAALMVSSGAKLSFSKMVYISNSSSKAL